MKVKVQSLCRWFLGLALALCILVSPMLSKDAHAADVRSFQEATDIDYTNGEGKQVVLTHQKDEKQVASYEINDTRLTRNASFYMSMKVKFDNSHSWAIRLRNVTCKIGTEVVTDDMVFRVFDKKGTLQVGKKSIDNWPTFSDINDNTWHTVTVRSTVNSFEIWIDGVRGKGLYYKSDVTDMVSNYTCPSVSMSGYNSGTIKEICVWNDGNDENPVMPADRVAQSIESLPDAVALKASDYNRVNEVTAEYGALADSEKQFVRNYDKLQQLQKIVKSGGTNYSIWVTGSKEGAFTDLFPKNAISHKDKQAAVKYFFETEAGRNSTFYIQFVVNMTPESNCFDVYLRDQEHTVKGATVSGPISLRMFKNSAVILDSRSNRVSEWVNYTTKNLYEGSHVITIESTPDSCTIWIDETKYEVPEYMKGVSGKVDCVMATTGFYMGKTVEGTVSNIKVWGDGINQYSAGDNERAAVYRLPNLNELTLADEAAVAQARELYNALDKENRKYVANLEKLEKLERAIAFIKEKGEHAYQFLHDDLPEVHEDYLNLISTGKLNIPAKHNSRVNYNNQTHNLNYLDSKEYINTPFEDLKGIAPEDTWLLKFVYKPYEYYYETETAAWMGLHITFSGYQVGGNGQNFVNKSKFAFFVNQCGIVSTVNGKSVPTDYLTTFVPEVGKEYHVSMLCEQGKMKIWINGEPVAYYDELPNYPAKIEFESSRCRGDVENIQLYNMSHPTEFKDDTVKADSFKFVEDSLYGVEGQTHTELLTNKKELLIIAGILLAVVAAGSGICIYFVKRKKKGESES